MPQHASTKTWHSQIKRKFKWEAIDLEQNNLNWAFQKLTFETQLLSSFKPLSFISTWTKSKSSHWSEPLSFNETDSVYSFADLDSLPAFIYVSNLHWLLR